MPEPVRLQIPAIALSASVIPLGLNGDGSLQVPTSYTETGWFTGGPEPGERGAAVIAGHVDSTSGPAVFYRLRALRRGDDITVVVKGSSVVHFTVTSLRQVPKTRFPTGLVYRRTTKPTLRLITCDGAFDQATGHYVDNLIVFAKLRDDAVAASGGPRLLPDLREEAPGDVQVVNHADETRLAFTSATTNVGAGPLLIRGERPDGAAFMMAEQDVALASGATELIPRVGHLHYVVNHSHQHWHLEPFAQYELRRASDGSLIGRDAKTGFCLGDRFLGIRLPESPPRKVLRTNCGRGEPQRRSITEGISVGYGDDYAAILEGQSIDITGLPAGRYYLVHSVNASHKLAEASYGNNVSWLLLRLTPGEGGARIRILGRCAPVTQPNHCASFGDS
jgi:LPXTG-site transpeptidase (sortase) family protein